MPIRYKQEARLPIPLKGPWTKESVEAVLPKIILEGCRQRLHSWNKIDLDRYRIRDLSNLENLAFLIRFVNSKEYGYLLTSYHCDENRGVLGASVLTMRTAPRGYPLEDFYYAWNEDYLMETSAFDSIDWLLWNLNRP